MGDKTKMRDTCHTLHICCYFNIIERVKSILNDIPQNELENYKSVLIKSVYTPDVLELLLKKFNPGEYSITLLQFYTKKRGSKCLHMLLKDERVELEDYWVGYLVYLGNLKTIKILLQRTHPYRSLLRDVMERRQWGVCRLLLEDKRVSCAGVEQRMKIDDLFIAHQMMVLRGGSFFGISKLPKELLMHIREYLSYIPISRSPPSLTPLL